MRHLISQSSISDNFPELRQHKSLLSITPNLHAARALGATFYPLHSLAIDVLNRPENPLNLVSAVRSHQLLREVIREQINPQDLEGTTRTWLPTVQSLLKACAILPKLDNLSDRATKLIKVAIAYQKALRSQNWVDQSEIFWRALESLQNNPQPQSLLIYGYFSPSWDEVNFINAIAGEESCFYLPISDHDLFTQQQPLIDFLIENNWRSLPDKKILPSTPGSWLGQQFLTNQPKVIPKKLAIQAHVYADQEAEARGVLSQIKQQLHEGIPSQEIVIVAANDRNWGPLLLDIAWEFGIALRLPYTIPLEETRVGAWLEKLLEVVEKEFPYEATRQLLRHPLSPKLDTKLWQKIRENRPQNFDQWQKFLRDSLSEWYHLKFPQEARRGEWIGQLKAVLKGLNLRQNATRWSKESVAYQSLEKGLEDLAQPESDRLSWQQFREEMLTSLKIIQTVAYPGREGIELHSPESIVGAKYSQVFVLDMLEGKLPKPVVNDPVFDFYERKQLQTQGISLPQAAELARKESLNFYYLLQTAIAKITFFYARLDHQGSSYSNGEPSSYFSRLGLIRTDPPISPISSPEMARQIYLRQPHPLDDDVLTRSLKAFTVEQYRESAEPADEYDGVVGISFDDSEHWFSASQLLQLGQCPFKWFASRVLKLAEPDEIDEELSAGLRGNLYHQVLEFALKAWQQDQTIDLTNEQQLYQWFLKAEEKLKFPPLPAWPSRRIEHIKILKNAIQKPEFLPADSEVLVLETKFQGEWHGLKITGRIDRIDRTAEGLTLIDYKTSSSPPKGVKNAEGETKIDLQLPLYQAVAAPNLYPNETVHQTLYYSLTKGKNISPKSPSLEELNEVGDRLKEHLTKGNYPVQPDIKQNSCEYCPYDSVCRKGDRLQRKGVL